MAYCHLITRLGSSAVKAVWLVLAVAVLQTPAASAQKRAPQLVIAQLGNPTALNSWNWTAGSEQDILSHLQESLMQYDRQAQLQPLLAESVEMKSATEWIIKVRKGVKFHEAALGELTAEDVKASIVANLRKGTAHSLRVPAVMRDGEVEVVDTYMLRWKLKEPGLVTLPHWLTDMYINSKAYLEREGFENEFLTGGIDVLPFVTPEIVPEIQARADLRIETVLSTRLMFIGLPVENPLLADKRVRQALNLAVNKQEVIEQLFRGIGAAELTAPIPLTLSERNPKLEGYPYDPKKAQQLLQEVGAIGKTLTFEASFNRYTLDREMGEAIAGYWEAVGLKVDFKPQDWAAYSPKVLRGSPSWPTNPFLMGFGDGRYLADYMYDLWLVKKPGGSCGAVYTRGPDHWDDWVREISLLGVREPRRLELLYKLQEEIMEYAPWVLVLNFKDIYALRNSVDWKPFPNERRDMYDALPR